MSQLSFLIYKTDIFIHKSLSAPAFLECSVLHVYMVHFSSSVFICNFLLRVIVSMVEKGHRDLTRLH